MIKSRAFAYIGFAGLLLSMPAIAAAEARDPIRPAGRWTLPERKQARTPPMGWSSWNAFRTEVDEDKVMGAARKLVDSGLAKLGYVYVNVDDGWWLKRRTSDDRMQIRTRIFPSAAVKGADSSFRPFTDRLHAMGLKAGIYSDIGRNACSQAYDLHSPNLPEGTVAEREVGLLGHVDQDIALYFGEWGFDYIKVDACGINVYAPGSAIVREHDYRPVAPLIDQASVNRTDIPAVRSMYQAVAEALHKHNPDGDFVFSICAWGSADVRSWGKDIGHLWRTSGDITPVWTRMLHTFDSASTRALYAKPGAWNDPDMLFIGHGDFDAKHLTEARSHFALWAIINAPLLIGYDLRDAPQSLLDIWGNADIVAVNQDLGGHQGVIAYDSDDVQIIVKTLSGGRKAVALFNRGLAEAKVDLTAAHLKFSASAPIRLRDLWDKTVLAPFEGEKSFTLAPRQTLIFEARGEPRLGAGVYLSEIPGDINVAADGVTVPEPDPMVHRMIGQWSGTRDSGERPTYAGWGGARADATPYDQTLQIAGRRFDTGIGILAQSRLEIRNTGRRSRFEALVGVDDSTRNMQDKVRFLVYGDGRLLTRSAPVGFGDPAQPIAADIGGAKVIEIIVARESRTSDLPVVTTWGDAALR
ncbi:NPCBM/NEW2 domain-containing protein [Sphingosinicella sp. BN140058]|uniref:NPCBM/NEW2 domain-containing protein n=1 Tax=Sphingosinicella sp. BN140058 TaxID=1892855 RepID=UPI001012F215|nr:NPCBM/NEW2 domain-containing protein [Sphingosinicella sp. BN140058]QAY78197.1 alpha-galactosidase [Sphingosinicella sp. BN140058]